MKVLVTDGHWRKSLAVVRSLGRRGVHVTVGERTFLNTSFFSKYCARRIVYPSPRRYPDRFIEFLIEEIRKNRTDCLFPTEEETLLLLARHRSEISKYTYLLIPDLEKIEFVRDKGNLIQFAEAHGIPSPKTFYIPPSLALSTGRLCRKSVHGSTSSPRTDRGTLKNNYLAVRPERVEGRTVNCDTVSGGGGDNRAFSFPPQGEGISGAVSMLTKEKRVGNGLSLSPGGRGEGEGVSLSSIPIPAVIKPRISSGSFGIVYVRNREDLISSYQRVHARYPFPLIQEWIPDGGGTFGISALLDEASNVKAAFIHKKLRMYPVQGGPSTLREGVEHPQIMELGLSLLKSLNWTGVGMVEFKVDPRDGVPKLMEVNPRFWGSLQLAIVSEVDFPYLILKMARGESFAPVLRYPVGRQCRWLLFGNILHFLTNPNRFHLKPSFFHFFEPDTSYDILSKDDPLPVLGSVATFFTFLYDPEMKRFLEKR